MNPPKGSITYLTSSRLLLLFAGASGVGMTFLLADTPLLVIVSGLTIACSFWLMQKHACLFNLRALTIPGFLYLFYIGTVLIPSFFVFATHYGPSRLTFLFSVESALLTVPFGVLFANTVFRFHRPETTVFFASPLRQTPSDPDLGTYSLFLVIAWLITCLYIYEVRTIPLFYMLKHPGEYEVLGRLREESLKLLDSPLAYVYNVLDHAGYPLLIVFSFGRYLQERRLAWAAIFLASLISGVLFAGFTIAKAPIAGICLMLCLYLYLHRQGRVGATFILTGITLVLAFPIFVVMNLYAHEANMNLGTALKAIADRMFYLPAEVLYNWFAVFPRLVPYQYGKTIGKLAILMGQQPFDADNVVGRYMFPSGLYSISANATFLGNLNADFGVPGVLVGGFLAGVILQAAQIYLVRRVKSVMTLSIYAILLYELHNLTSGSLPVILLSGGPIFVLILAWSMMVLSSVAAKGRRIRYDPGLLKNPQ